MISESETSEHLGFAQTAFNFDTAKSVFEDALDDAGVKFEKLGWDWYDCSLEIYDVPPDIRLSADAQRIVHEAGFAIAFVNHSDGWETHYFWGVEDFEPKDGWRKRRREDGGIDVNRFPTSWPKEWLESGHVRVVPDS